MSSWMISADKLDREQEHFINNELKTSGNKWIKGLAGSGKSILLMHCLANIKRKEPNASVGIIYFTHSLRQMYVVGMNELKINAIKVQLMTYIKYQKSYSQYQFDYILCDEVQDLTPHVLMLMRDNCKKLYVSGDPNQSIYIQDPSSGRSVVLNEEISEVTNSSEYPLTTIHRLTKSIVNLISTLIPDLGMLTTKTNAMKKDVSVRNGKFKTQIEEVKYITKDSLEAISIDESAVILLPTHGDILNFVNIYCDNSNVSRWIEKKNNWDKPDYGDLNEYLDKSGIKLHYIGNGYGDLWKANKNGKVILMTYYSVKGLDFDNVYLPFLNENANINNETIFMVALSRSKNSLLLSHTGNMHQYLNSISKDTVSISTINEENKEESFNLDNFDF